MAIKARVLHFTSKGKILAASALIGGIVGSTPDTIPPAYNCEKEKLVVILASLGKDIPDKFRLFCRELTTARAANVALVIDGPKEAGEAVAGYIREAGANVVGEPLYIKGGLPFAFLKSFKEDEQKVVTDWINGVVAEVTK